MAHKLSFLPFSFSGTWVWFLAPMAGRSQLPVTPAWRASTSSSGLHRDPYTRGTHKDKDTHTHSKVEHLPSRPEVLGLVPSTTHNSTRNYSNEVSVEGWLAQHMWCINTVNCNSQPFKKNLIHSCPLGKREQHAQSLRYTKQAAHKSKFYSLTHVKGWITHITWAKNTN